MSAYKALHKKSRWNIEIADVLHTWQTHLQPEITCYLETDNKKQNEVDQEIFRDKGFIQISSWCFVRAEKHTNLLRVRNPHSRSLESGGRGPPWILNA